MVKSMGTVLSAKYDVNGKWIYKNGEIIKPLDEKNLTGYRIAEICDKMQKEAKKLLEYRDALMELLDKAQGE